MVLNTVVTMGFGEITVFYCNYLSNTNN